ncbi:MAG TPA: DUF6036 family nucleotidyltransferase [Phycisphaerae bacterium]|nr:DUF6036 family nucleotidyltransferase [Phycisphaerae bacterium]
MTNEQILIAVLDALQARHVPYMLTGSLTTNFYGIPRSTMDVDLVVSIAAESIRDLLGFLPSNFRLDPQVSFETVTGTTRYVLEVEDHDYKAELFLLSEEPHDSSRFARRRQTMLVGRQVFVPTPEDVVISKLRWCLRARRPKDLEDVRNVLAVQRDRLDYEYINRWCAEHGTLELLEELRRQIHDVSRAYGS